MVSSHVLFYDISYCQIPNIVMTKNSSWKLKIVGLPMISESLLWWLIFPRMTWILKSYKALDHYEMWQSE